MSIATVKAIFNRWLSLLLTALVAALLAGLPGCTGGPRPSLSQGETVVHPGQPRQMNQAYLIGPGDILEVSVLSAPGISSGPYALQPGDTLLLEFHRNEYLNRNLLIRPDGMVTLPYLGEVKAAGLTARGLAQELSNRYQKYFKNPKLTLSVVNYNAPYKELQTAFTNSATGQSKLLTVALDGTLSLPLMHPLQVAGRSTTWVRDQVQPAYSKALGNVSVQIDLKEIKSNLVYVLGEVNRPGVVNMSAPMTVTQLIALSGGYKDSAGLASVVLMRPDENNHPTGRVLNINKILAKGDMGDDVLVQRYDVVYVPPSMIHQMNLAVLFGIRNMMPIQSNAALGFQYLWGAGTGFKPF